MTRSHLFPLIAGSLLSSASAEILLWSDNFTGPTAELDSSSLTGRRSGAEASTIMLRSAQQQHYIFLDQLYLFQGRARFQTDTSTWCNWAATSSAADILSEGGLTVEFDFKGGDTDPANWIGFAIGTTRSGEPDVRTTDANTDYGFRLGKDGSCLRYDGGVSLGDPIETAPATTSHVKLDYAFRSFDDGATVRVKATVNGEVVSFDEFTWDGNGGELYMELENRGSTVTYFDNLTVSTATVYGVNLVADSFRSGAPAGSAVGQLSAESLQDASGIEASSFTLVSGEGDTDNAKFSLNAAGELLAGYDFGQNPAGTAYSIRVRGTGSVSGLVEERQFSLVPIKDDDMDLLPDPWELSFPDNTDLANLTGLATGPGRGPGSGDYDGDGIPDLVEYETSLVTPGYSPISADSDGDGVNDDEELMPTLDGHLFTNPLVADTDRDGLLDGEEYTAGTNPLMADMDGDGARDGFEILRGSDPDDYESRPPLPAHFAVVQVTDDASTGIAAGKTYTHHVSGGGPATINGVAFDVLTPTAAPANFTWTLNAGNNKASFSLANNADWIPADGGVTGAGLQSLLSTFTYGSANDNAIHAFELGGLTPGQTYEVKLFVRKYGNNSIRPLDLYYTNGSSVEMPFGALVEDLPGVVLNNGNNNSAYYLSYTYVAQGTSLKIEAKNPAAALANSGGMHFYGLTNEVAPPLGSDLKIVSVTRDPSGQVTITFTGSAATAYRVTRSPDLATPFVPLATPLVITTDANGMGQAVVPAGEASEAREFYRIED